MLSEALRVLRQFHDLKSKDMAYELGISPSYLSEIERGKKEPNLSLIRRYAEVFNTTPSSILFFSEDIESAQQRPNFKNIVIKKTLKFLQDIENTK